MKPFYTFLALTILSLQPQTLPAEIVSATISWDAAHCNAMCTKRLEIQLNKMNEVTRIDFDGEGARATLFWRPGQALRSAAFKRIASNNNLTFHQVDITLRGTISKGGKRYFINSLGDQTQMEIFTISKQPPEREQAKQPYQYNKRYGTREAEPSPLQEKPTYALSKRMAGKLDEAIKAARVITLAGSLVDSQNNSLQLLISEDSLVE